MAPPTRDNNVESSKRFISMKLPNELFSGYSLFQS
jgi:hypothetical protein